MRKRRDERRAHRTLREQVAYEVGDTKGDAEGIHGVAGPEVKREHLIANQPQDATGHGGQTKEAGRTGQARSSVRHARRAQRSTLDPDTVPPPDTCPIHTKEKGSSFGSGALKEDGERLTRPFNHIDG